MKHVQIARVFKHLTQATILLTSLFVASFTQAANSTIGIVVFDGFLTSDVTAPVEVFGAASKHSWFSDYNVVLISSTSNKTVKSEEGLNVVADRTIYDALDLDVLVVPSAYDMEQSLSNDDLIDFIQSQHDQASWMSSNCSGAFLLGEAGVLNGKKATTWAGGERDLAKQFPEINVQYDQNVVVDAGIVTSNGGPVSYQAALELLAELSSEKYAAEISEQIQFDRLKTAF